MRTISWAVWPRRLWDPSGSGLERLLSFSYHIEHFFDTMLDYAVAADSVAVIDLRESLLLVRDTARSYAC